MADLSARVLVVDDTPANARLVRAILEPLGCTVDSVESGPDALDAIRRDPPDLVLLDLNMPGMNGHEVCRRVRELPETATLPIVMMTAAGAQERVHALDAGADDFVVHPLDRDELAARVRSLVRIKRFHDTIQGQAAELAAWNDALEEQVREQVGELQHLRRLQRFLSPALARALMTDGDESLLAVHRREVAVVVCELRGFATLAGATAPEAAVEALAGFHELVHGAVVRHEATIGYSTGERMMLLFNDPIPCTDPVGRALDLAVEIRDSSAALVDEWAARGDQLGVASGISFGHATLGVIGAADSADYTAVGPVVTEASDLAASAPVGGVVLSDRARLQVADRTEEADAGLGAPTASDSPATDVTRTEPPAAPTAALADHPVAVAVLGPLAVTAHGRPVELGGAKSRALLARLAAAPGADVPVERLAAELWGVDTPEDTAVRNLRVNISRLRKALEDAGAGDVLVTRPGAYRLALPAGAVDAARFDDLVATARRIKAQEPDRAVTLLRAALALWRGTPYADAGDSPFTDAESARLVEDRTLAVEDCIDAELAQGRHREVLPELEALVVEHPLRERLWGQRMIALYRGGRQPEALRVYQQLRERLADELGLDPSPELQSLEQAIARRSSALDLPAPAPNP